jgi:hypothetical protein
MAQVTCFLCNGTNHVPAECYLYPSVQQMNQQAKDRLCMLLGKTNEDRRSKMKVKTKVMEKHTTSPPSVASHVEKKDAYLEIA